MSLNLGTLWVVATPLGNPGDFSPRAREVLESADGVLAEDTRRAGLLFARCGLRVEAPLSSFHDHNEEGRTPQVLEWLQEGKSLALVSDAGTPLLSDPGYRLVRACRQAGFRVSPVPGPSAPVAALSACGLPPQPFVFLGFLPRKATEQESALRPFADLPVTLIFFERKDRLAATLAVAAKVLGSRDACIARELTKTHEEFLPFSLDDLSVLPQEFLGEITVVVGPPSRERRSPDSAVRDCIREEFALGGKPREVALRVKGRVHGWHGKEVYQLLQDMKKG